MELKRISLSAWRSLQMQLPVNCLVCGLVVTATDNICEPCLRELPWLTSSCSKCGEAVVTTPQHPHCCGRCTLSPPPFSFCRGVFHYRSPVDQLITGFKFNARFEMGHALAALLATKISQHYAQDAAPDLLLPVPLHRARLRVRGYNQALEIAKLVSSRCQIPLSSKSLARVRATIPQTEINSAQSRVTNLRGAFQVRDSKRLKSVKCVAIIDDVVTTMATVAEISKVLHGTGIEAIHVWCLARASR